MTSVADPVVSRPRGRAPGPASARVLQQRATSPAGRGFLAEPLGESPWRVGDMVRYATRLGLGLVGIVVAWIGCSGSVVFRHQAGWIAGGVLAAVVSATGGVAWLLSGLGVVSRERSLVRRQLLALHRFDARPVDQAEAGQRVTGQGMTRFHRLDCEAVRGKKVHPVSDAQQRALVACAMCSP